MTRHGMVETTAAGAPPSAMDPRASMTIADANMRPTGPILGRQYRAKELRSGLSTSTSALPTVGRANADISPILKSP